MTLKAPPLVILASKADSASAQPPPGWPLLRLGFRPFYLGAAVFAVLAVVLWVAMLRGAVVLNLTLSPVLWHAHEMLFGFAVAVIVGFLLTAGKAWTGLATPRGGTLAALALLWLTARVAAVVAPYPVYALLDILLLPLVAVILIRVLLRAGSKRNLPLGGILLLLTIANLCFHLAVLGLLDIAPIRALHAALALIVMIECVIGGRVIPAFTMSALPGVKLQLPRHFDTVTLAVTAVALTAWVLLPANVYTAVAFGVAAVLHAARLFFWKPWRTIRRPILWVLHLAYAWVPVAFVLLAWTQWGAAMGTAGVHALAVGATGGLVIGMMTRTARGHTGRPLQVSKLEVTAYLLITAAALSRVLWPLLAPQQFGLSLLVAGAAWCLAFGIYLYIFTPWLLSTRLVGKDG